MKRGIREFIRIRKTIRSFEVLGVILALVLVNVVIFGIVLGRPFKLSYAGSVVSFGQSIFPANPVRESSDIEKMNSKVINAATSNYRIIVPINDEKFDKSKKPLLPSSQSVTFNGTSLRPNDRVLISLQSDPIFAAVSSDSQGKWSWTGFGGMLEAGEHLLKVYDISFNEASGKNDVFIEAYPFAVSEKEGMQPSSVVNLNSLSYGKETVVDDDVSKKLFEADAGSIYLFDASLINKRIYDPEDEMVLRLSLSPLGESKNSSTRIRYEMYAYDSDSHEISPVTSFKDDISVDKESVFLKKIRLQKELVSGAYVLKVSARIYGRNYVQYVLFDVSSKPLIQIGGSVVTEEKFKNIIAWNVTFLIFFALVMVSVVLYELQRFMVFRAVDGNDLRKRGFFRNSTDVKTGYFFNNKKR